jgi:hypothetical protein
MRPHRASEREMSISDTFPRGSVVAELIMRSHRNTLRDARGVFLSLSSVLTFTTQCAQTERERENTSGECCDLICARWTRAAINGQTRNIKIAPCCVTNGIFGGCRPAGVCGGPLTHSAASSDLTRATHRGQFFAPRTFVSHCLMSYFLCLCSPLL